MADKTKLIQSLKLTRARSSISLALVSSAASSNSSSSRVRSSSKSCTSISADGSKSWSSEPAEPPWKITRTFQRYFLIYSENMSKWNIHHFKLLKKYKEGITSICNLIFWHMVDYSYIQPQGWSKQTQSSISVYRILALQYQYKLHENVIKSLIKHPETDLR